MSAKESRVGSGWRWKVAYLLNRSRRTCWTDLVGWALRDTDLRECLIDDACRADFAASGHSCYCGKLTSDTWPELAPAREGEKP